ncbi:GM19274 [Drosophila sechellia]|uniref:GM19274 n=1 Tax=Drosophila sechellia TaxID=7238 RepID=B4INC3_DROSE|nr:GM19274 [Drosophila sechellia]
MVSNELLFVENNETLGRKPSISNEEIKRLVRQSKNEPFKPAKELKKELQIQRWSKSQKSPQLLTVKHVAKRIEYAKIRKDWPVEKWRHILWSDESKIVFFGGKGSRSYVRRPPRAEYNPRLSFKTVKHGGSNIMVWACFSYYGVVPIHRIQGIMDQHIYTDILENVMAPYAEDEIPFFLDISTG